jgi:ribosomal protein S12 methylthiotransferase
LIRYLIKPVLKFNMRARSHKKNRVNVVTLGCSKNMVDSEVLMGQLRANDFDVLHEDYERQHDIIIVNTCGFIDKAKAESIQTILEYADLKKKGHIDKLYVTGCLSERYKNDLEEEIAEVDGFFGTMELPSLLKRLGANYKHELLGERQLITPSHYAYLKISEGCNRTCSFCAIPLMRGKHVSKPMEVIVDEARKLVTSGVKEIMLIAQELTYYGLDIYKERKLATLLDTLADVEGLEWIRLHYAYPSKFPMDVLPVIRNRSAICNYIDMPLQHISDHVLQRMKRQITKEEIIKLIQDIRNEVPGIAIRTTMLVGFPGETDADFNELCDFIQEQRFERVGVFTYSHEEGTSGYAYEDDVSEECKAERASALMDIQTKISQELNQIKIGNQYKVLVDRKEGNYYVARTEFDSPDVDNEVLIDAQKYYLRIGEFATVRITDAVEFDLYAEPVS